MAHVGATTLGFAQEVGGITMMLGRIVQRIVTGRVDGPEFLRALWSFGPGTGLIALAAAGFVGMIMVLQSATYVEQYGAQQLVGWFTGFSTVRELAPVVVGLMFSGRIGASHCSELAAMGASEQMDALRILALDVTEILLAPRALAMAVAMVLLVGLADIVAIGAGAVAAYSLLDVAPSVFYGSLFDTVDAGDFLHGLVKAFAFAGVVAVVSSYYGMRPGRGAQAVARAVNRHVVIAAVGIFWMDYLVTMAVP